MLRAKLQSAPADSVELRAALETIQALWEELQSQAEDLKDERERFAEFFEFAPEALLITEPGGEIREANRAARELLGAKEEELLEGASLVSFVREEARPDFRGRLLGARRHPDGEAQWTGALVTRDGRGISATLRARPIKLRARDSDGLCWHIQPSKGDSSRR